MYVCAYIALSQIVLKEIPRCLHSKPKRCCPSLYEELHMQRVLQERNSYMFIKGLIACHAYQTHYYTHAVTCYPAIIIGLGSLTFSTSQYVHVILLTIACSTQ